MDNWAQVQMIRGRKPLLQYSQTVAVNLGNAAVGCAAICDHKVIINRREPG